MALCPVLPQAELDRPVPPPGRALCLGRLHRVPDTKKPNPATKSPVTVDGKTIEVAIAPDRTFALVGVSGFGDSFTVRGMEKAASVASGCTGVDNGVLSFVNGGNPAPISTANVSFERMGITLKC